MCCYNRAVFTGLVRGVGTVAEVRELPEGRELAIQGDLADADRTLGASVAISGVCLTVTRTEGDRTFFEAAFETLRKTTLGQRQRGARVNLEPALRMGDPLGGHLVSGHVDGVATVDRVEARGDAREIWIDVPAALARFVAEKGSVTLEGVSLTVNDVEGTRFMVGIIPHTLSATTLGEAAPGLRVNLEVDVLARYVARLLEMPAAPADSPGLRMEDLLAAGLAKGESR